MSKTTYSTFDLNLSTIQKKKKKTSPYKFKWTCSYLEKKNFVYNTHLSII